MRHTHFRGIALVNALKPRRSVKISSPKMTMNQEVLAMFGMGRQMFAPLQTVDSGAENVGRTQVPESMIVGLDRCCIASQTFK
jgi:hypothetical protein